MPRRTYVEVRVALDPNLGDGAERASLGTVLPVLLAGVIRQRFQVVVDLVWKGCAGEESTKVVRQVPSLALIWVAEIFGTDEDGAFKGSDQAEISYPDLAFLKQARIPRDEMPARLSTSLDVRSLIRSRDHHRTYGDEESGLIGPGEVARLSDDHRVVSGRPNRHDQRLVVVRGVVWLLRGFDRGAGQRARRVREPNGSVEFEDTSLNEAPRCVPGFGSVCGIGDPVIGGQS